MSFSPYSWDIQANVLVAVGFCKMGAKSDLEQKSGDQRFSITISTSLSQVQA